MAVSRKGKTVGRPRGHTTIRSREIADRLAAIENALTPLEVMIEGMRALWRASQTATTRAEQYERLREAISAAKDAAPYMHPRLSSITASIRKVNNIKDLRDDELAAQRWSWFLRPLDGSPKVEAGTVSCFC